MDLPQLVFWILMGVIVPVLAFLILRAVLKKEPYKFKMSFRVPGVDKMDTVYGSSLEFKHDIDNKEYEIKAERLYRYRPGKVRKIIHKFKGIKESFFIVYQYNKTEPLAPHKFKVSSRILKEVSESRALDKALRSEFKVPWDMKKILMVIGFLVIAVVVWAVISGEISI